MGGVKVFVKLVFLEGLSLLFYFLLSWGMIKIKTGL